MRPSSGQKLKKKQRHLSDVYRGSSLLHCLQLYLNFSETTHKKVAQLLLLPYGQNNVFSIRMAEIVALTVRSPLT